MRRRWASFAAAAVLAATAITVSLVSVSSAGPAFTVHVLEHPDTDAVIDTGAGGDTSGDLLTFANPIYNQADTAQVGTDQGDCIRIVTGAKGSWECRWVTRFPEDSRFGPGSITVEGPFFDAHDSTLAVTGGTGIYRGVTGTMRLEFDDTIGTSGGYHFIFRLTY